MLWVRAHTRTPNGGIRTNSSGTVLRATGQRLFQYARPLTSATSFGPARRLLGATGATRPATIDSGHGAGFGFLRVGGCRRARIGRAATPGTYRSRFAHLRCVASRVTPVARGLRANSFSTHCRAGHLRGRRHLRPCFCQAALLCRSGTIPDERSHVLLQPGACGTALASGQTAVQPLD